MKKSNPSFSVPDIRLNTSCSARERISPHEHVSKSLPVNKMRLFAMTDLKYCHQDSRKFSFTPFPDWTGSNSCGFTRGHKPRMRDLKNVARASEGPKAPITDFCVCWCLKSNILVVTNHRWTSSVMSVQSIPVWLSSLSRTLSSVNQWSIYREAGYSIASVTYIYGLYKTVKRLPININKCIHTDTQSQVYFWVYRTQDGTYCLMVLSFSSGTL